MKRKLDDVFQSLDDAVKRPKTLHCPSFEKKNISTFRSLYSSLSKYGIKFKEEDLSKAAPNISPAIPTLKSTPNLSAILTRAAKYARNTYQFSDSLSAPPLSLHPFAEYRPSSVSSFLSRLETFKLVTYSQKPPAVDALAAAKRGWINDGKDRLVCGLCKTSWVIAGMNGLSRDAANALVEKQHASLVQMHKEGCPWKVRQCDPSIYCIPLTTPFIMVRDLKINATVLTPLVIDLKIKHPLTSTQLSSLFTVVQSFVLTSQLTLRDEEDGILTSPSSLTVEPLETAILVSLFGWGLTSNPQEHLRRASSISRAAFAPSAVGTPTSSRAPSVRPVTPKHGSAQSQESLSTPSFASTLPSTEPRASSSFNFRVPFSSPSTVTADRTFLKCILCQRRIGLWAFVGQEFDSPISTSQSTLNGTPSREFDLLKEHRSYCPYVTRSAIIPGLHFPESVDANNIKISESGVRQSSFNVQIGNDPVEGWRAVLTIVLRYGVGKRRRLGIYWNEDELELDREGDEVRNMVKRVKTNGGKELLYYVKGLLG